MKYPLALNIVTAIPDTIAEKLDSVMPITIGICEFSLLPLISARVEYDTLEERRIVEDILDDMSELFADCESYTFTQTHDSNHDELDDLKRKPCDNSLRYEIV